MVAIGRRAVLWAPVVLAAGAPGWVDALAGRGPGLLRSYDVSGGDEFDVSHANCAYTYDNAVTGLALLAAGRLAPARAIGEALLAAQARDRFFTDGRLRNAYAAGVVPAAGPYPLPGWWDKAAKRWIEDEYQVGTATGVVAWVMMLWVALGRATGDARFAAAAGRAGDWVERSVRVPDGYSGGFNGWEPGPTRLGWISTEHNLDLAVAFAALGRAAPAAHALAFVAAMWNGKQGRFFAGRAPDGAINPHPAADANLWPLLSPVARPEWAPALAWTLAHQGVPAAHPQGIDFDDDRDGIWLEGTAYAALAARRAGRADVEATMLATLRAQTAPGGLVWASTVPRLTTGLATGVTDSASPADFVYFRRPHIGATAWAVLAVLGKTPFNL